MPSYNQFLMIGNCTRDPIAKQLPGGSNVAEWGMACNRKFTTSNGEKREDVLFIDCEAWGKSVDTIMQYVKKGKPLFVEGRLKYSSFEDKSGAKRSKISLIVDSFQFVGGRDDDGESQPAPRSIGEGVRQKIASKPVPRAPFGDERHFQEADIPF